MLKFWTITVAFLPLLVGCGSKGGDKSQEPFLNLHKKQIVSKQLATLLGNQSNWQALFAIERVSSLFTSDSPSQVRLPESPGIIANNQLLLFASIETLSQLQRPYLKIEFFANYSQRSLVLNKELNDQVFQKDLTLEDKLATGKIIYALMLQNKLPINIYTGETNLAEKFSLNKESEVFFHSPTSPFMSPFVDNGRLVLAFDSHGAKNIFMSQITEKNWKKSLLATPWLGNLKPLSEHLPIKKNLVDEHNTKFIDDYYQIQNRMVVTESFRLSQGSHEIEEGFSSYIPQLALNDLPIEPTRHEPDPDFQNNTTFRKDKSSARQIDLGCNGKLLNGSETLDFASYGLPTNRWQGYGNVALTRHQHHKIFGSPTALASQSDYFDEEPGYCYLSTGDGLNTYQKASPTQDKTSSTHASIRQTLTIPSVASSTKSLQIRLVVLTQELPTLRHAPLTDNLRFSFVEAFKTIGNFPLSVIAENDFSSDECQSTTPAALPAKCGRWHLTHHPDTLPNPNFFDISSSTDAAMTTQTTCPLGSKNCYTAISQPLVFCYALANDDFNTNKTLEISVSDGGDAFLDTAVAIDTVVFSKLGCESTFTGEPRL